MKSKFNLVLCFFSVMLYSCTDIDFDAVSDKEAIDIMSQAMQSPESDDAIEIVNTVIDDYLNSVQTVTSGMNKAKSMIALPVITLTSEKGIFPESYEIDFGDGYYVNSNGKTIRGKVYFTKSDKLGTSRTYQFSNFYFEKTNVKSFRTIVKKSAILLEITAKDTVTFENGTGYTRQWNRTRKLIKSNGDVTQYWNNSYEYEGSSNGTTVKNTKYQMSIQKPLVTLEGYKYYVSGVVKINTDKGEQFIDFGKGAKDNIATVKTNGKDKQVTLNWD